jgi:hypothetical protein
MQSRNPFLRALFLAAVLVEFVVMAAPDFHWANSLGSSDENIVRIAIDADESCYAVGYFRTNQVLFGSNSITNSGTNTPDLFIAKYDKRGSNIWARSAGSPSHDEVNAVAVDGENNVYVVGSIFSDAWFGTTNVTPNGSKACFITKLDSSGNFLWARQLNALAGYSEGRLVAVRDSRIYVVGNSRGGIDFGGAQTNDMAMFLAEYDPAGELLVMRKLGSSPSTSAAPGENTLVVDADKNIYVSGFFQSPSFSFGGTNINRTSQYNDGLFTKWDQNGNLLWFRQIKGGRGSVLNGFHVTSAGDVVITGTGNGASLEGHPFESTFLARLSADGSVKEFASIPFPMEIGVLAGDAFDNTIISGSVPPAGFNFLGQFLSNSSDAYVPYVAKLGSSNSILWAAVASSAVTNTGYSYSTVMSLARGRSGSLYLAGLLRADLQFGTHNVSRQGYDSFLAKLNPESPTMKMNLTEGALVISWATNQQGFVLQKATTSNAWAGVEQPVQDLNGLFSVTNSVSLPMEIFRLYYDE